MAYGYAGKFLYIDLTKKKVESKPLDMEMARKFIGGKGFTAKILYDLLQPKIDPLSPDNVLVFATGPINGTIWPGGNKNIVATKSPLTNIYMDSYFSGGFGAELKYAGYDALIIKGKAEKPTYLWIDDANVEFRDATHIWGKTTYETYKIVKEELGDDTVKMVCIGPAGENKVRFACVDADVHRQAGRCGGGAVMGSKNLKAIAVRGSGEVEVAKLDELLDLAREGIILDTSNIKKSKFVIDKEEFLLWYEKNFGVREDSNKVIRAERINGRMILRKIIRKLR